MILDLQPLVTPSGAVVSPLDERGWHLEIPAGAAGVYRVAQLDDYHSARMRQPLPRGDFPWRPPLRLSLRARVSERELAGTWGFGWWNDPFSVSLGIGGAARRFPAFPNAAWFFYASPPNFLSFRDDLPAQGLLAATFFSPQIAAPLLAAGAPGLALGMWPPAGRLLRKWLARLIHQDATRLQVDPTQWHVYSIEWLAGGALFAVDGQIAWRTPVAPGCPLALVIWVDNQFAAFPASGRLGFGTLPGPRPAWMEITDLAVETIG